jgi:hypothetical protein
VFVIADIREKLTLKDYYEFSTSIVSPQFMVSPCEQILPHTGRKKKVKACLQSLTNVKLLATLLENQESKEILKETQVLVPIWLDMLHAEHDYSSKNYLV